MNTKLLIIRGPSGVGKSSVTKVLMKQTNRPTALVDLDHYRLSFVNSTELNHNLEYERTTSDILTCLKKGFDVIFDGNFTSSTHDPFIKNLIEAHPYENYIFYLDASLEETLNRHKTRENAIITEDKMREVYKNASPIGSEVEVVIPEDSSLEQTVTKIKEVADI